MNEDIFCTIKSLLIKAHIVKGRYNQGIDIGYTNCQLVI